MSIENTDGAALAEWTRKHIDPGEKLLVLDPEGNGQFEIYRGVGANGETTLHDLRPFQEPWRTRPQFRTGTAVMVDLNSFVAHVNRFQTPESALFANGDRTAPAILAVLDYHDRLNVVAQPYSADEDGDVVNPVTLVAQPGPLPRFGKHRTLYNFPLSDEWVAWHARNKKQMTQTEFAEFLEDRLADVTDPPDGTALGGADQAVTDQFSQLARLLGGTFANPQKLLELSRGLTIHSSAKVKNATNISSGVSQIVFEEEHRDEQGAPVTVPNLFMLAIPVFKSAEERFRVAVRLRYRKKEQSLVWNYDLYRTETIFDVAYGEAIKFAANATGLPLLVGAPEK